MTTLAEVVMATLTPMATGTLISATHHQRLLVIDLDRDGIELIALEDSRVQFDLNVDGFAERTGWVQSDDGLLALDVNGNGFIDDNTELFGDGTGHENGFQHLAELDSNADGQITAADDNFAQLLIWQDTDADGQSDAGELAAVSSYGIASIDLAAHEIVDQNAGHLISHRSTAHFDDGSVTMIDDVHFSTNQQITQKILSDDFEYNIGSFIAPVLMGTGNIASTTVALSENTSLLDQALELIVVLKDGDLTTFMSDFEGFIHNWAGVQEVSADSRGSYVNGQHLAFLEAFHGSSFQQLYRPTGAGEFRTDPNATAGASLESQYALILETLAARFIAQSAVSYELLALMANEPLEQEPHPFFGLASLAASLAPNSRQLQGSIEDVTANLIDSVRNESV